MLNLPLTHDFTGKVVVVTGAGGVLCGDMARAYAQAGAKVAALDLNEAAVLKLAEEVTAEGFIMKGYKANVLELEALEAVHQQILADLGPCDILVNGAGGNNPRANHVGVVQAKDSFYGQHSPESMPTAPELLAKWDAWKRGGCLASEMEGAALFIVSAARRLRSGAVFHCVWNQEVSQSAMPKERTEDTSCAIKTAIEAIRILIKQDKEK